MKDSFEGFILRRFSQWWNAGVDNVHARMLGLPETVDRIVDDVKGAADSSSQSNEDTQ